MASQEQDNKELVRELIEAFNREDVEFMQQVHADELLAEFGWDLRRQFDEAFPDHRETIEHIIAEDDMVAFRYQFSGTHTGAEYLGVPPTGAEVSGSGHIHVRIEEGEIVDLWQQSDDEAIMQALGIHPESVAESRIQTQLLEVLLRVLRHNISNDLNAITGLAEMIVEGDGPAQDYAGRIQDRATDLQATAEKVREVERAVVHKNQTETVRLAELLGSILATQRDRHPQADIDVALPGEEIAITSNRPVLSMVLEETIENAVVHADTDEPEIQLDLSPSSDEAYAATVVVADDGPGIPDHELTPVERGSEDPLEHGSGIGLWAIKWGVEQLAGNVEFADNDPTGTVVKMDLADMD